MYIAKQCTQYNICQDSAKHQKADIWSNTHPANIVGGIAYTIIPELWYILVQYLVGHVINNINGHDGQETDRANKACMIIFPPTQQLSLYAKVCKLVLSQSQNIDSWWFQNSSML